MFAACSSCTPQQRERREDGEERGAVQQERPAGAHRRDQKARERRPDDARGVEGGGVERHGVRKVLLSHELADKGLPHRGVERGGATEQERKDVDMPELHAAGHRQQSEQQCERPHRALGCKEQSAPVHVVGGKSRKRQEQHLRGELQRRHDADRGGVALREPGEYQPCLRRALHPRAHVGHEGPRGPQAVVEAAQ